MTTKSQQHKIGRLANGNPGYIETESPMRSPATETQQQLSDQYCGSHNQIRYESRPDVSVQPQRSEHKNQGFDPALMPFPDRFEEPPQSIEQREWTKERDPAYPTSRAIIREGTTPIVRDISDYQAQLIVKAHNAALATERQRADKNADCIEFATEKWSAERQRSKELLEDCEHYSEFIDKREQQLATERQRREQAEREVEEMNGYVKQAKDKLLSALTAIENLNQVREYWIRNQATNIELQHAFKDLDSIDLSALHQHDVEVRKPLVDVLEEIKAIEPKLCAFIEAALA